MHLLSWAHSLADDGPSRRSEISIYIDKRLTARNYCHMMPNYVDSATARARDQSTLSQPCVEPAAMSTGKWLQCSRQLGLGLKAMPVCPSLIVTAWAPANTIAHQSGILSKPYDQTTTTTKKLQCPDEDTPFHVSGEVVKARI